MFFVIPTGRRYTSTASGTGRKTLVCEKCGKPYSYTFPATASATCSRSLVHDKEAAKSAAEKQALENLNSVIKDTVVPVACPSCSYYQSSMIEPFRKAQFRALEFSRKKFMYAWFLGYFVSALVGTALQKVAVPNGSMQAIATALTLYLVWFPLIPLGLRIFVFFARKRIDPNARWSAPIASASGDRAE